jgi:hypothetical protein
MSVGAERKMGPYLVLQTLGQGARAPAHSRIARHD